MVRPGRGGGLVTWNNAGEWMTTTAVKSAQACELEQANKYDFLWEEQIFPQPEQTPLSDRCCSRIDVAPNRMLT